MCIDPILPSDWIATLAVVLLFPLALLIGYRVTQIHSAHWARCVAWAMVIAFASAMALGTQGQPPAFRVVVLIGILMYTLKAVVVTQYRIGGQAPLGFGPWIAFAGFWIGMRPALFRDVPRRPRLPVSPLLWRCLGFTVCGIALTALARVVWVAGARWQPSDRLFWTSVLLLSGLSLIVHFGGSHLLAGVWRAMGAECNATFRSPWKSTSLAEFWGQRWNRGFAEMATVLVFRPVRRQGGDGAAILMCFAMSGLIHEFIISVPVDGGYGLPSIYFALNATGMMIERNVSRWAGMMRARPWVGRLWVAGWIVLPLPLLLHRPFLRACVWPLIGIDVG